MNQLVYNKANSIQEIRGLKDKKNYILNYLRQHKSNVKNLPKDDPFKKAISDLFDEIRPKPTFLNRNITDE